MFKVIKGVFDFIFDDKPRQLEEEINGLEMQYKNLSENSLHEKWRNGTYAEKRAATKVLNSMGYNLTND